MEKSLQIVISAIIILVTALVVLIIFNSGTSEWLDVFNKWGNNAVLETKCNNACSKACMSDEKPSSWADVDKYVSWDEGDSPQDCEEIMKPRKCTCGFLPEASKDT